MSVNVQDRIFRQYRRGKDFRTEFLDDSGNTKAVTIFNFDRRAMYRLDPQAKQVVEMQRPDVLATFARWITRPARIRQSGKIVDIYYETIDTGERRQQFGFTARHFLLRERHIGESGSCGPTIEIETDGWYLALPNAQEPLRSTYLLAGPVVCSDTTVKHGSALIPGFPVQETITTKSSNPTYSLSRRTEVPEFSAQPLDKSLFEIPDNFKRNRGYELVSAPGIRLEPIGRSCSVVVLSSARSRAFFTENDTIVMSRTRTADCF